MANDILDPAALVAKLPSLLPASSQRLSSPHDGIAALIHTILAVLAFRLIAVDDDSPTNSDLENVLPEGWNKNGPSHYTLRYRHDQSSMEFAIKLTKLGPRTLINAIALETDKAESLDIATQDFISQSFYPHDISTSTPLVNGFISSNRIVDLTNQLKLKIISKLLPGLRKDGYNEPEPSATANAASSSRQPPQAQPQIPRYNPEEDYPYGLPPNTSPRNPLQIGRRDLDPFPQNPFAPPPLFPGGDGDGMIVGPNHPIFGRGEGGIGGIGGMPRGPWGGDGFLPPMGAPPGARFDPVGPFPGPGRRMGPQGGNNRRNPDNDEFMPPGFNNDMYM